MGPSFLRAATVAGLVVGALAPAAASAGVRASDVQRPWLDRATAKSDSGAGGERGRSGFGAGSAAAPASRGLPPALENFEVISKFETPFPYATTQAGQIADVAVYGGTAYLNGWDDTECRAGGVHIVDVKEPAKPKGLGFLPAAPGYYHGEGAHATTIQTANFKGDLLAVNNEAYSGDCATQDRTSGGFDLIDVSDPAKPKTLVRLAGDRSPEGSLRQDPNADANSYHSVFLWQDGPRAYLVGVDNTEFTDVDIYDVTDPTKPVLIADLDLVEEFPQIVGNLANGNLILHHDSTVKQIKGRMTMLVDYWDAGYVQLDVTTPSAPKLITDTSFDMADPLTGFETPEGNAHQGEFSFDDQFVLAADEDFSPYRAGAFSITSGPAAGQRPAQEVGGGTSVSSLPDQKLNGPTVYGGYGCDSSKPVPRRADYNLSLAAGEEAIIVLQRGPSGDPANTEGACFPGEKAANGIAAGWDAVLLVSRHVAPPAVDDPQCGSGGYPEGAQIVTLCTTHEAYHRIFRSTPDSTIPYIAGNEPALGARGEKVEGVADFDGWGYTHLYDATTSEELDAYAIPEALDPRFAFGFGDLSVHEFATDPETNVAYASYYAGGLRAFRFSREQGLVPTAKFIDPEGSNFWGVEQFTAADGQRYVAGSDRDFGLVIVKYTGPGAPTKPTPAPAPVTGGGATTPPAGPAAPAAAPPSVPDGTFTVAVGAFKRNRFTVRFTTKAAGISSAELRVRVGGRESRLARRAVMVKRAGTTTYTMRLSPGESARLRRAIARTRAKRLTGTVRAAFTAKGASTGTVKVSRLTLRR